MLPLKPSSKTPGRRENHEACSPHTPTCHLTADVPLLCCTIFPRGIHLGTPSFMGTHAEEDGETEARHSTGAVPVTCCCSSFESLLHPLGSCLTLTPRNKTKGSRTLTTDLLFHTHKKKVSFLIHLSINDKCKLESVLISLNTPVNF